MSSYVTVPCFSFSCTISPSPTTTPPPTTPPEGSLQATHPSSNSQPPPDSQAQPTSQGQPVFGSTSVGSPVDPNPSGNPSPTNNPISNPTPTAGQQPPATSGGQQPPLTQGNGNPSSPTVTVNGVPIGVSGSSVVIGGTPVAPNGGSTTVTTGGQVFTVNPSQVVGPGTTVDLPAPSAGAPVTGSPAGNPTPTVVDGVTVAVGSSVVVVGGLTFTVTPGVPPTTTVANGQTISIGPGGVGFPSTTLQPGGNPTSAPDPVISTIAVGPGSSVVIIGSSTFTFEPESVPRTTVIGGQTISIGPGGIGPASFTAGPGAAPTTQVVTIGGVSLTEIGSKVAIGSQTFTVGPGASPTTVVVNGQTFSIGPGGIGTQSTIIPPPQNGPVTQVAQTIVTIGPGGNPTTQVITGSNPPPTSVVTIGGVPLTEIGSTVIIGTQTFTVGPSATPTTVVVNGQTFSIGPGGIGTQSTTIPLPPNGEASTQVITAGGVTFTEISFPSSTVAIFGGQTFTVGTAGPGLVSTTIAASTNPATQVITAGGITFTEISSSLVVIGGSTFTIGPGATPTTDVFNGQTISIGSNGVGFGSTTVSYDPSPAAATQVVTAGGVTFTEIGSSIVVIGGSTFTIGPGAMPTTDIFNSQTISIGPNGVGLASTTVSYDPSPAAMTQVVTAGGITFTEIGSTLVVIGGSTFTIGPNATPTTDIFASQTISIGPNGVGFASMAPAAKSTGAPSSSPTHNSSPNRKSFQSRNILAMCVLLGFWFMF